MSKLEQEHNKEGQAPFLLHLNWNGNMTRRDISPPYYVQMGQCNKEGLIPSCCIQMGNREGMPSPLRRNGNDTTRGLPLLDAPRWKHHSREGACPSLYQNGNMARRHTPPRHVRHHPVDFKLRGTYRFKKIPGLVKFFKPGSATPPSPPVGITYHKRLFPRKYITKKVILDINRHM